jgi:hypothetical protein
VKATKLLVYRDSNRFRFKLTLICLGSSTLKGIPAKQKSLHTKYPPLSAKPSSATIEPVTK